MKRILFFAVAFAAFAASAGGGYWFGRHGSDPVVPLAPTAGDRVPVAAAPEAARKDDRGRILYYRNPMGLPDTSPTPKKDAMGMEYIPVYDNETADDSGAVRINLAKVQRLGVRTEAAATRELTRRIRAAGTVQLDERRLAVVSARFEGWIERLLVNETGQPIRRGQPLMEAYSPELVTAQQEYLFAARAAADLAQTGAAQAARGLADAALQKLRNWNIAAEEIERLKQSGEPIRSLTLRAPSDGIVLEKNAVAGMRFMPGEPLYRIADLSTMWLIAEISEQDLGAVSVGQQVRVTVAAYPGRAFDGKVSFLSPMLARDTRTARVRIEIPNPERLLRVDMYATVEIAAPTGGGRIVTVPDSAVLDSGTRQIVLIERGEGLFEPRDVTLGAKAEGFYEILAGVAAGEKVVTSATFLIDAESNLRAALKAFTAPAPKGETP